MNKAKSTGTIKKGRKFKALEKDAINAPVKDVEWEGEEIGVESTTKIEDDHGTGQPVVLRFFEFGANAEAFKQHKPTAQELFNSHRRGIESLLWRDGLKPFEESEPRLMFSKNKSHYRIIMACIPRMGSALVDKAQTLSQLLNPTT